MKRVKFFISIIQNWKIEMYYKREDPKKSIPFYTPFVEQRKGIDRLSALYIIKVSLELMYVDIDDICFFLN